MLSESVLFDRDGMETMLVMGGSAYGVYTNTVEARITDSPRRGSGPQTTLWCCRKSK